MSGLPARPKLLRVTPRGRLSPSRSAAFALAAGIAFSAGLTTAPREGLAQRLFTVTTAGLGEELTCIGVSHRDPSFVMVGTAEASILRSLDGGATWQHIEITAQRDIWGGRERYGDANAEYGLGLPGKSPHLQSWLRRSGLRTSGINMRQLLYQKGDKSVAVLWIEVSWHDENLIFVGTTDGLYRSNDKGRSFTRIFQGIVSQGERVINAVATDPSDPRRLTIGTASGVFTSNDGGLSFRKTMNYYLRDSYVREVRYDPENPSIIHVAMGGSAMASPDGGENWITTHWTELAPRADVQSISLGPDNIRIIGTRDGVLASWHGGEMGTWQRRGLRFAGMTISKVLATTDPNLWLAVAEDALWYTTDQGINWSKLYLAGGKIRPRWVTAFRNDPRHIWFITNRQVHRVGPPPLLRQVDLSMRRSKDLLDVPPVTDFVDHVLRRQRLCFSVTQRYRDRAPWGALVPRLVVQVNAPLRRMSPTHHEYMYRAFPYRYYSSLWDERIAWSVRAYWDLGRLFFDKRQMPHWGRVSGNLTSIRQGLRERIYRLYDEYQRTARVLIETPPANALAREYHEIRLQEISAYFDGISGGFWSKASQGAGEP